MNSKPALPWNLQLCEDDSYWHKSAFDSYPSIIAHEYWRVYDLLENGQTYGAFLQMKDTLEVILKFPVLVAMSLIYRNPGRTDGENKCLHAALHRNLSLGDWVDIAIDLATCPSVTRDLKNALDIAQQYRKKEIAAWRNEQIGHGALAFDTSQGFKKQMEEKLKFIKRYLPPLDNFYTDCEFYFVDGNEIVHLKGKDLGRNISCAAADLFVKIKGLRVCLYPFVLLNDHGIYFFDTYVTRSQQTKILDYPNGAKVRNYINDIMHLYTLVSRDINQTCLVEESVEGDTYSLLAEQTLEKRSAADDIEPMTHLHDLLRTTLEQPKGVYLLQMERGTGKTTFVRTLDEQSELKEQGKSVKRYTDVSIRAYYVNDTYQHKPGHFITKLFDIMRSNASRTPVLGGTMPHLSADSNGKGQELAHVLNYFHREHVRHFRKERLLFIIDGVDEAPVGSDAVSILDFIPSKDWLDDGVYVLVTSRTSAENTSATNAKLAAAQFNQIFRFEKESADNVAAITRYIERNNMHEGNPAKTKDLLDKANYRFLYIRLLREIYRLTKPALESYPAGEELLNYYLEALKYQYSSKFFYGLSKVLIVVGTAMLPLTAKEIAYLCSEETVTFALLAYLSDLNIFFRVDRSLYRGNIVSIAHANVGEMIRRDFAKDIEDMLQEWISCIPHLPEDVESLHPGHAYLLANVQKYHAIYGTHLDASSLYTIDFARYLLRLAKYKAKASAEEYDLILALASLDSAIDILNSRVGEDAQTINLLASAYDRRGTVYRLLYRHFEAVADYDKAIGLLSTVSNPSSKTRIALARVLNSRGNVTNIIKLHDQAISDFNQSLALLLSEDEVDGDAVGRRLNNRGNSYRRRKEWEKAIQDYSSSISMREELLNDNNLQSKIGLAIALTNRGRTYRLMKQPHLGLADLNRSISLFEESDLTNEPKRKSQLASALNQRGLIQMNIKEYPLALLDFDRAIDIKYRLLMEEKLFETTTLALILKNKAAVNFRLKQFKQVAEDCTRALEICEKQVGKIGLEADSESARSCYHKLASESKSSIISLIANITNLRGRANQKNALLGMALEDFSRSIRIRNTLNELSISDNTLSLASALEHRSDVLVQMGNQSAASQDLCAAMRIYEDLAKDGEVKAQAKLASIKAKLEVAAAISE